MGHGWGEGRKMSSKRIFTYQVHVQLGEELEKWTAYRRHLQEESQILPFRVTAYVP